MKFIILFLLIISSVVFANDGNKLVKVVYNFETNELKANDSITIIARITPEKNWHTYWLNPGDAGMATDLNFNLPEGFKVGPLKFECPTTFPFDNMINFGYSETSHIIFTIYTPNTLPSGKIPIIINSNWLVCKDVCLPGSKSDTLVFNNENDFFEFPDFQRKLVSISNRIPDILKNHPIKSIRIDNQIKLFWDKSVNFPEKIKIFPIEEGIFKYEESYSVFTENDNQYLILNLDKQRVNEPDKFNLVFYSEKGFEKLSTKKAIQISININKK